MKFQLIRNFGYFDNIFFPTHKGVVLFKSAVTPFFYVLRIKVKESENLGFWVLKLSFTISLDPEVLKHWDFAKVIWNVSQFKKCLKTTKFCRYYRLFQNLVNAVNFMRSVEDWKSFQSCLLLNCSWRKMVNMNAC